MLIIIITIATCLLHLEISTSVSLLFASFLLVSESAYFRITCAVADHHQDSLYFRLTRENSRAKTFPALRASARFALFFIKKCRRSPRFVPFVWTSVWTSSPPSRKFSGRFRACETFAAPFAACCGRYRVLTTSPSP